MSEASALWLAAGAADDIAEGGQVVVEVGELSILVVRLDGEFFAVENRCGHVSSPLAGGRIRRGRIACPLHGAVYDLRTGASFAGGFAPSGLRTFATRLDAGEVSVAVQGGIPNVKAWAG